jgi:general secretion pathway protein D
MVRHIRLFGFLLCAAAAVHASSDAERLYREGQRAERAGDSLHAYLLYARAAALEPNNEVFASRKMALQAAGKLIGRELLGPDPAEGTAGAFALAETPPDGELPEVRQTVAPPQLKGSLDKKSFDLKGDARAIFEKVAEAYGLGVVFQADYQAPPEFSFRVTDLGYEDALRILESVANSFLVPVNERLALVVRDTAQKRTEMTPDMSLAIPIPERMSVQDAQEIVAAVQQTLELRHISVDPTRHMVFLRDAVSKVSAARLLFENLSRLRPQVEVEVEFVSIEKSSSLNYGLNLPNSVPIVNFGTALNSKPTIPAGFTSFLTFGGGATFLGMGVANAAAFATLTRSSAEVVLTSQIVSLDGQAATLHVGDRYPIITAGYYGATNGAGQVYSPPPVVNFEDLGVVLKVTPAVHDLGEVTLDVDADFKALGTTSSNGIPVIASRKLQGKLRLGSGEWAVIAGLVSAVDSETRNGIAGLSDLPWLGRFFSQNSHDKQSTEILIVLKPHLVTPSPWDFVSRAIWVGSEAKPVTMF